MWLLTKCFTNCSTTTTAKSLAMSFSHCTDWSTVTDDLFNFTLLFKLIQFLDEKEILLLFVLYSGDDKSIEYSNKKTVQLTIDSDGCRFTNSPAWRILSTTRVVARVSQSHLVDDEVTFAGQDEVGFLFHVHLNTVLQPEYLYTSPTIARDLLSFLTALHLVYTPRDITCPANIINLSIYTVKRTLLN